MVDSSYMMLPFSGCMCCMKTQLEGLLLVAPPPAAELNTSGPRQWDFF